MRDLTAYLILSLDGVAEAPDRFVRPEMYADLGAIVARVIAGQDAVLLGGAMYREWAAFWPGSDIQPFADFINGVPKFVVSQSLAGADWPGSTLLSGPLEAAVADLKAAPGGTIGVHGSISLVQSLLRAGLIDELRLALCPVAAGQGRRPFGAERVQMDLISAETMPSGVQYLVYRPRWGR